MTYYITRYVSNPSHHRPTNRREGQSDPPCPIWMVGWWLSLSQRTTRSQKRGPRFDSPKGPTHCSLLLVPFFEKRSEALLLDETAELAWYEMGHRPLPLLHRPRKSWTRQSHCWRQTRFGALAPRMVEVAESFRETGACWVGWHAEHESHQTGSVADQTTRWRLDRGGACSRVVHAEGPNAMAR